jgi:hypothetical protein
MHASNLIETFVNAKLAPYLFGALGWILMWELQGALQIHIAALDYATGVALIFLPAGIRTLAVLIFGFRGAVGVFLGCNFSTILYFEHLPALNLWLVLTISAISAFSAYLMMQLVCWWKKIGAELDELTFNDVLTIVITQGLLSASLHQLVFAHLSLGGAYVDPTAIETLMLWAAMAAGDIVGSMLLMLSAIALSNLFHSLRHA